MVRRLPLIIAVVLQALACTEAAPQIEATTRLRSTTNSVGPYGVTSIVTGLTADHKVELFYAANVREQFIPVRMEGDSDNGVFDGAIPGHPTGTEIGYFVAVSQDGVRLVSDPDGAAALPLRFSIISVADDVPTHAATF